MVTSYGAEYLYRGRFFHGGRMDGVNFGKHESNALTIFLFVVLLFFFLTELCLILLHDRFDLRRIVCKFFEDLLIQ